jgi:hypothetical protein
VILVSLSILGYFFAVFVESNVQFFIDLFGVFLPLMMYPNTYFILLMVATVTYMTEKLLYYLEIALQSKETIDTMRTEYVVPELPKALEKPTDHGEAFHGYAFSSDSENNPNPDLAKQVRKSTSRRLSQINSS